ncbi:MAG: YraN family protein [Robiginitalea sp.]|jgi:putative endonuclease
MKYQKSKAMADKTRPNHYRRGMEGEEQAVAYLRREGYEILCRNYRYQRAEVDIFARHGEVLLVVEVKTRTDSFYEALSDTVSKTKIARLVRAADHFVRERGLEVDVRFDIIQLTGTPGQYTLVHWKDAFYYF